MPASSPEPSSSPEHERLSQFLELLAKQGISQQQVARRANLPPQYLSDIKKGRRPLSELVARRLGDQFGVDYLWLLEQEVLLSELKGSTGGNRTSGCWLPVFPHPIAGDPKVHPDWDGLGVEVAGAAAARLGLAKWPYILRYQRSDILGRLQPGDLVLISQELTGDSEIFVIQTGRKLVLARRSSQGGWQRVANRDILPASCTALGRCLGVVWSDLEKVRSAADTAR